MISRSRKLTIELRTPTIATGDDYGSISMDHSRVFQVPYPLQYVLFSVEVFPNIPAVLNSPISSFHSLFCPVLQLLHRCDYPSICYSVGEISYFVNCRCMKYDWGAYDRIRGMKMVRNEGLDFGNSKKFCQPTD